MCVCVCLAESCEGVVGVADWRRRRRRMEGACRDGRGRKGKGGEGRGREGIGRGRG